MKKILGMLFTSTALIACGGGGGGGDDSGSTGNSSSTTEGPNTTTDYKAQFIANGWDCGPTDNVCYKVEAGTLFTGSTSDGTTSPTVIQASTLYDHAMLSFPTSFNLLGDCTSALSGSDIVYSCFADNTNASSSASNLEDVTLSLSVATVNNDLDGLPYDTTVTSTTLDPNNLAASISSSDAAILRQSYYQHAGYTCDDSGVCRILTTPLTVGQQVTDSDTVDSCSIYTGNCTQASALSWIYSLSDFQDALDTAGLGSYIYSNSRTCSDELKDSIYCTSVSGASYTYIGRVYASANVAQPSSAADFTFTGEGSMYSPLINRTTNPTVVSAFQSEKNTEYSLSSNLPTLPSIPTDTFVPNLTSSTRGWLQSFRDTSVWGDSDNIAEARAPNCYALPDDSSITPNAWMQCDVFVSSSEVYECSVNSGVSYESCALSTSTPSSGVTSVFNDMLKFHNFDYAYSDLGVAHSSSYPITIVDSACDIEHNYINSSILGTYFYYYDTVNSEYALESTTDVGGMHFSTTADHWESHDSTHCNGVAGVTSLQNGAYTNLINVESVGATIPATIRNAISTDIGATGNLISKSSGSGTASSIQAVFSNADNSNQLLVVAGGNSSQNWTNNLSSNSVDSYENAIVVGAVDWNKEITDFSAVPGSNSSIQNRWIVALGESIVTAGGVSNTNSSALTTEGTSFATPLVSRAANIAKAYCPSMSYRNIATVILSTADSSFTGYDPSIHGVGLLDVRAMMTYLNLSACSI